MRPFPEAYKNGEYVSFFRRLKAYFSKNYAKTESTDGLFSTRIDNAVRLVDELGNALRHELLSMDEAATALSRLSEDMHCISYYSDNEKVLTIVNTETGRVKHYVRDL